MDYSILLEKILDFWGIPTIKREQIRLEIRNSFHNMELAFKWEEDNLDFIEKRIQTILAEKKNLEEQKKALIFSEQIPFKGHPIHICTKTKIGFTQKDIKAYCPEFCSTVSIKIIGVKKECLEGKGDPNIWATYLTKIIPNFNTDNNYYYFPVHPWQLENIIKKEMIIELSEKIIVLTDYQINSKPSLSFRTVSLPSVSNQDFGYHIKLPTGIQATSVFRSLRKRDLYNGIIYSKLIRKLSKELFSIKNGKGRIINESYGCHYISKNRTARKTDDFFLSFMLRDNPLTECEKGETFVVASSLTHCTNHFKKPLITYFIEKSKKGIRDYFASYIEVTLSMPLELFLKYGIAMAPHGQNIILALNENFEVKSLVYRDLGSILLVKDHAFINEDFFLIHDEKDVVLSYDDTINELVHSLYLNLIKDLIKQVSSYYNIPKKEFWKIVKDNTIKIIDKTETSNKNKQQFSKFIFSEKLPLKSFMKMRLSGNVFYTHIKNPML